MARAGLGDDLLLANETLDADRLRAMAELDVAVTVAVDSPETVAAASGAGIRRCLIDVNVGLPRCGCHVSDAGRLADRARALGLEVRGVMGYEGHATAVADREERRAVVERSMEKLLEAHASVGGDVVSAGSTVTYDLNTVATEIQAGSYALMDSAYAATGVPFRQSVSVLATVVSVSAGWAVADCGDVTVSMTRAAAPALSDGGRIIFVLPELIFRKRVSPQLENMVHFAGMLVLLLLMVYINVMDFINPVTVQIP